MYFNKEKIVLKKKVSSGEGNKCVIYFNFNFSFLIFGKKQIFNSEFFSSNFLQCIFLRRNKKLEKKNDFPKRDNNFFGSD